MELDLDEHSGLDREERRLALLSALQELTTAALALFDPQCPVSDFLLRLAERMQWTVAICLELRPDRRTPVLLGSAGLCRQSRALGLAPLSTPAGEEVTGWSGLRLPYPEVATSRSRRWLIPLQSESREDPPRALLLFTRRLGPLSPTLRGTVMRLVPVLQRAFTYRALVSRLVKQTTLLASQSEASDEGILVVATDGRVVFHTRRFLELWGFERLAPGTPSEPVFRSAAELVCEPEAFLARIAAWRRDPDQTGTLELPLTSGRTLELHTVPVRSADGERMGRGWYFRDITTHKQVDATRLQLLEQERQARADAEDAVRARDDFLSRAAHELRTPVTRLRLRLDAITQLSGAGGAPDQEQLRKLRDSMSKLTLLINDLLDFSRVQAGNLPLHLQPVQLAPLVEEVVEGFRLVSPRHRLTVEGGGPGLTVRADPSRLEQVISNLLENAIKYSPAGGEIRIRLERQGQLAALSVTDPGIGIPPEERRQLFSRFFRAGNAPSQNFAGLGLGLYISRDIVERHGGRISVESELGRGSTFQVTVPLWERPEAGAGRAEALEAPVGS